MAGQSTTLVSSFVFLDLEATGLAGIGEKPRITELSLVAVHRTSLLEKASRNTPRILNKLTLCLNPQKAIGHEASSITGLYNDALSLQCPFSETVVDICNLFFEQLPLPICLLAHNGNKYDFPLLAAELHSIGRRFPEDILCADTLDAFRDVLSLEVVQDNIARPTAMYNRASSPAFNIPMRQPNPKHVRKLNMDGDRYLHQPSNVTPEMQVVKSNVNFGNAPKKKPLPAEPPKAVRISSAKRKLEFGPSASKNEIDDVDREDVLDSIHGFHLSPQSAVIVPVEKCDQNDNIKPQKPKNQWDQFNHDDDITDEVLLEVVAQFEQSLGKPQNGTQASASACCWSKVSANPARTFAQVIKGEHAVKAAQSSNKQIENNGKPASQTSVGSQSSVTDNMLAGSMVPSDSQSDDAKPVTTNSPVTPTTNGNHLDSFPTPSPSPHKDLEERVLSSTLSPLAVPFVPQSNRANPNQSYIIASGSGRLSISSTSASSIPLGISLALKSLHKRVMGYDPDDSHRAEDDCMSLLRLCNKLSPWVCDWVDSNSAVFRSVAPLYKASKRPRKP